MTLGDIGFNNRAHGVRNMKFQIEYMLKNKQGILLKEVIEAPFQATAEQIFDAKWNGAAQRIRTKHL